MVVMSGECVEEKCHVVPDGRAGAMIDVMPVGDHVLTTVSGQRMHEHRGTSLFRSASLHAVAYYHSSCPAPDRPGG